MAGYWRTGGHDEPSEPDRPERVEQRTEQRAYGDFDPDEVSDDELLSYFGYKNWDEWREAQEEASDEPLDLDEPDELPAHVQEAMEKSWRRAHPDRPDQPTTEHATDTPIENDQPEKERLWKTVAEETGELKSFHSYSAAKRELGTVEGKEIHHIVEQSQAKLERSGFSVERINTTDNLTRIPIDVHRKISADYSTGVPFVARQFRDTMDGLPRGTSSTEPAHG